MNYLLARLKGRGEEIWKVMSQNRLFHEIPDLSSVYTYSSDYKLEDDEWFSLDKFSERGFANSIIDTGFNSTNYNQITTDNYSQILYLCYKQGNHLLFQKMNPSQLIKKKWFEIVDAPTLETNTPIIVLSNYLDAVYNKTNDILYFKDLVRLKQIFKGIDELYREATNEEVQDFVDNHFVNLGGTFGIDKIKTANRKRIASVVDRLEGMSDVDKKSLIRYTKDYCEISFSKGKFNITSEDELKKVLYGIEERYYTTILGKERRLANSVLSLDDE